MFAIQQVEETETIQEPQWQDLALCNDGSGSMTELFFSEQLDDIAAAKAFAAAAPCVTSASRARSIGASRGACGVASCSCTARSSPRSASADARPRCAPKSRKPKALDHECLIACRRRRAGTTNVS